MNIVVLGLGGIAHRVIQGIKEVEGATLYGVASSSYEKASMFQQQYNAIKVFDNYQDVYDDPAVELIYIATINKVHYQQITNAILAKKHVICEKPMVTTEHELKSLFALAKKHGVFLMEAEKTIFTSLNQTIKKIINIGEIGDVVAIEGTYCNTYYNDVEDHNHWVFDKEFGGCTFDIGVYPICYANFFADAPITNIHTEKVQDKFGVDIYTKAMIRYANGIIGSITCGWICNNDNLGIIYGSKGYIETKSFWKTNETKIVMNDGSVKYISLPESSDFKGEIEHAIMCINKGELESPILGEKETLDILKVVLNEG